MGRSPYHAGGNLADPAKKRRLNDRLFTVVAPKYDRITGILSFGRDRAWKRQLIASFPERPSPLCLDLACGTGDMAGLFAKRYPSGLVAGVDQNEAMLRLARKRHPQANVRFFRGDMGRVGLPSASVDFIAAGYALRNAGRLSDALDEVFRLLKPGGMAAFLDFSRPKNEALSKVELKVLSLWGGVWGIAFHRDPAVYGYIAESLAAFPHRDALAAAISELGFELRRLRYFFGGIVELRVVAKPCEGCPA